MQLEEMADPKESEQLINLEKRADSAFEAGKYAEAYNYCAEILGISAEHPKAVFRKGLCAGYLSLDAPVLRMSEVLGGYGRAVRLLEEEMDTLRVFTAEYLEFAGAMTPACDLKEDTLFQNLGELQNFSRRYESRLRAMSDMCSLIPLALGKQREELLSRIVYVCSFAERVYFCAGTEKTPSGQMKQVKNALKMPNEVIKFAASTEEECKRDYYALPHVQQQLAGFDTQIVFHRKTLESYKKAYSEFIGANPVYLRRRRKIRVWDTLAVVLITLAACAALLFASVMVSPWGLVAIPAAVAAAGIIWKRKKAVKLEELDGELMPAALSELRLRSLESGRALKDAEEKRKAVCLK